MFRVLVLVMAAMLLAKATIALAIPRRFYAERQRQYAMPSPPGKVFIGPAVLVGLALTAWYATIVRSEPWGWVVAASLTAFAFASVYGLLHWRTRRLAMGRVVANPKVWRVDCALLASGALLVSVALLVFD